MHAPLLSRIERECIDHFKLLLLSSLMLLQFLLGIAVLLRFEGLCSSFHKRKIDKLNSSPIEKCFWSLSKKMFNNFCNSSFPSLICPDGSIACSPTDKANLFGSYFSTNSSLSDSNAPNPPTQPLSNPMPSIKFAGCFVL